MCTPEPLLSGSRYAMPTTVLLVIGGWTLAGVAIVTSTLIGWPPVSSVALDVVGWEVVTLAVGVLLAAGGLLLLAASLPGLRLSTRWRLEGSALWLLGGAWIAYGAIVGQTGAAAVVLIIAGHVAAAGCRLWELRKQERTVRAITEGG